MKHFAAALVTFACAAGFFSGGVADDVNPPIIVNNKTDTLPPLTMVVDKSTTTEAPITVSTNAPSPQTTTSNVTTSSSTTPTTPATTTTAPSKPTTSTASPKTSSPSPTTTPTTTTPTSTAKPQTTTASLPTTPAPHKGGNHFDGPSFIGGIILATGLMGIGFVAFKFYKARTERNYHTL